MKNIVHWDVVPCGFIINRRFGGTCRLVFRVEERTKMEATRSSETSVYSKLTRRHIPEDCIFQIQLKLTVILP
jgi:hypothetical protein